MIRILKDAALSLTVGVSVAFILLPPTPVAGAQDAPVAPEVAYVAPPAPVDLAGAGMALAVAAAIVYGAVLMARTAFRSLLAPSPATPASKTLNLALAVAVGLLTGVLGVAPDITGGTGLTGHLASGFLAACLAVFGRDFFTNASRGTVALSKRKKPSTDVRLP